MCLLRGSGGSGGVKIAMFMMMINWFISPCDQIRCSKNRKCGRRGAVSRRRIFLWFATSHTLAGRRWWSEINTAQHDRALMICESVNYGDRPEAKTKASRKVRNLINWRSERVLQILAPLQWDWQCLCQGVHGILYVFGLEDVLNANQDVGRTTITKRGSLSDSWNRFL